MEGDLGCQHHGHGDVRGEGAGVGFTPGQHSRIVTERGNRAVFHGEPLADSIRDLSDPSFSSLLNWRARGIMKEIPLCAVQ